MRFLAVRTLACVLALIAVNTQAESPSDTGTVVDVFSRELTAKTDELVKAYPDLQGRVKISMTVEKGGMVSLAEVKDSRLNDSEPLTSILETVYKWKFTPLAIKEPNVRITHILAFGARFDSTRIFFIVMAAMIGTITFLIVLVRVG